MDSLHGIAVAVAAAVGVVAAIVVVLVILCPTETMAFSVVVHRPWTAFVADNRLRAIESLPPALYHQHQLYSNYDIQHELRLHVTIQQVAVVPYKLVRSKALVCCSVHRPYYSLRSEF